jgi:hypothetical protein
MSEDLRYPIGKFRHEGVIAKETREQWISEIAQLPAALVEAVVDLREEQLDTPYRPEGWTVRQVAHHLPDSHMNSWIRFKLALTEQNPTIRPYEEQLWAELPDAKEAPVAPSIALLQSLHDRWATLLRGMGEDDFGKTFYHPGSNETFRLDEVLGMYAWHGRHHVAQIQSLRNRMGW